MPSVVRRLAANWKLKTLAFALAVLLWVVVSAEQVTTNWFTVPLEVQVTDPNFRAVPTEVREVQVRFSGASRDLLEVAARRPPLRLVIPQVGSESGSYELHPRMVQVPGQLAVNALDVRPGNVAVNFTRMDSRVVPVRPRVVDALGPGWALVENLTLSPDQIRITGPAVRIGAIQEIFTQAFELTPVDTVFERMIPVDTAGLQGLELSARSVTARARVDRVVERVIGGVPVSVGPGVTVTPAAVNVRLHGPERTLATINPAFFRVVVAIDEIPSRIPPEGLLVPLRVDRLRSGVQAAVEPAQARLFTRLIPTDTIPGPDLPPDPDSEPRPSPSDGP